MKFYCNLDKSLYTAIYNIQQNIYNDVVYIKLKREGSRNKFYKAPELK